MSKIYIIFIDKNILNQQENKRSTESAELRRTRARPINLTLGNEREDEDEGRIEERKSEYDEDPDQQWQDDVQNHDRIMAFEPIEDDNIDNDDHDDILSDNISQEVQEIEDNLASLME